MRFIDPAVLHWFTSAEALVMVLLGGMGTLFGPILGAIAFLFSRDLLSSYTEHWRLILGVIFVVFVIFFPEGLVGLYRKLRAKLQELLHPASAASPSPTAIARSRAPAGGNPNPNSPPAGAGASNPNPKPKPLMEDENG